MPNFELLNLIHALDKGEKIRFKEFGDEEAHYCKLYDALNDSPPCSEAEFKNSCSGMDFMERYSYNKGYLFNTLMDAMRSQRQRGGMDKLVHHQVADLLQDAEFLHDKTFVSLCVKRLDKAEKLARKYELHEDLLKILRFQLRLLIASQSKGYQERTLILNQEMVQLASIINNKSHFQAFKNSLLVLVRVAPEARDADHQAQVRAIVQHDLLSEIDNATSFDARLNYHFCHALIGQTVSDRGAMLDAFIQVYQLWQDFPHFQVSRPTDFKNALNNYLIICCDSNYYEHFAAAVTQLQAPPFRSLDQKAEVKQNALYVLLHYYIRQCRWSDARAIEIEFDQYLPSFTHKLNPSRKLAFYISFARFNHIDGNLDRAIAWTEKIVDLREAHVRRDIWRHALLYSLILFHETGRIGELENRYRVVMRSLKKEELVLEYERQMVALLKRLPGIPSKAELKAELKQMLPELERLAAVPQEAKAQGFEFIRDWVASQVEGGELKTFLEKKAH